MKIITIIVTYNGMKWIDSCLRSLRMSTVPCTTVVIDNMSTDGTLDFIRANYPEVIILPQTQNLGFGQANNVGMRYALEQKADYVLLLNQDAYIADNMIQLLLAQSDGKSLLSPVHLNGDGSALDANFKQNTLLRATNTLLDDLLIDSLSAKYPVHYVNAACWFMPISILHHIGGFNPLFRQYSEDDNYVHRLHYHHIPIYVVPQAKVRHDRKVVGNITVYKKGKVKRELFSEACNIDHTFPQRLKQYLKVINDQRDKPLECLQALLWLPTQTLKTAKSHKVEKQPIPHWL